MRLILAGLALVGTVLLGACGGGSAGPGGPTAAAAQKAGVSLEDAGEGYAIYLRKCMECHKPLLPEAPLSPGWHSTVSGMTWNAGLSKSEAKHLLAYLQAAKPQW